MGCYLFNPHRRDHKSLFGIADAFFDLDTAGSQSELHKKMAPGDACVVVSYSDASREEMVFSYYRLDGFKPANDPERGAPVRVLCGPLVKEDRVEKSAAIRRHPDCFDRLGRLKQLSVL